MKRPRIFYKYHKIWDDEDIEFFEKLEDLLIELDMLQKKVKELSSEKEQGLF